MSNREKIELVYQLLNKMEECVNRIKMLNAKFQQEVKQYVQ